ncbi:hypothetical protein DB41_CX00170 [Neochlamydia sp. TUME1]|uniref:hypothetical protein n=1 Tax=Neochlamydia sp. TUME1 TaxID=1478174 RepID=UPI00057CA2CB|nr:hypothetical protein [Neochlamydia sp. TUME1]KIC77151.1 hypothetical protein DB41_CX00170 [Neochlamydia sp. TUME1]
MQSDSSFHLKQQLGYFREIENNFESEQVELSAADKVKRAHVIMIGESHGFAQAEISSLVNTIALEHLAKNDLDRIAILDESEEASEARTVEFRSIKREYNDRLIFGCWDNPLSRKSMPLFANQVIQWTYSNMLHGMTQYLSEREVEGLSYMHDTMKEAINKLILWSKKEEMIEEGYARILEQNAEKLSEIVEGIKADLSKLIDKKGLTSYDLKHLQANSIIKSYSFMDNFSEILQALTVHPLDRRNRDGEANINRALQSCEKVVVIAGRSHLKVLHASAELEEKTNIKKGIQPLYHGLVKRTSRDTHLHYVVLETPPPEEGLPAIRAIPDNLREEKHDQSLREQLGEIETLPERKIKGKEKDSEETNMFQINDSIYQSIENKLEELNNIKSIVDIGKKFTEINSLIKNNRHQLGFIQVNEMCKSLIINTLQQLRVIELDRISTSIPQGESVALKITRFFSKLNL